MSHNGRRATLRMVSIVRSTLQHPPGAAYTQTQYFGPLTAFSQSSCLSLGSLTPVGAPTTPTSYQQQQQRTAVWPARSFAASKEQQANQGEEVQAEPSTSGKGAGEGAEVDGEQADVEELLAELKEKETATLKLTQQVETLTDALKRSLADMENLRTRTAREVDNAKKFGVQGFVKSLLDVADNLERAASVVPQEALADNSTVSAEKLRSYLSGIAGGVKATENIMLKVFKQHGIERYDPMNQSFDPNFHNAILDIPDPSKQSGTVGLVMKRGYTLNDRVIRPAEVGVVRNA